VPEDFLGIAVYPCRIDVVDAAVDDFAENLYPFLDSYGALTYRRRAESENGDLLFCSPENAFRQFFIRLGA